MLIVKGPYLPGFTEPERDEQLEAYLTGRGYCVEPHLSGAEIAHYFHSQMVDAGLPLEAGSEGFKNLSQQLDYRNKIIASAARHNCMSAMWWMVECECERRWNLYAGVWNDELGFMVLDAPCYHSHPLVWLTRDIAGFRRILDLSVV